MLTFINNDISNSYWNGILSCRFGTFIVNFEQIFVQVILLLTLNSFLLSVETS